MADVDTIGLLIAALSGAAVGIERQWSGHAAGPRARFGGVRTFTLIGGLGGLGGGLWTAGLTGPAVVTLAGATALIIAAYVAASAHDVDGTTEVAALVVLTSGVLAGSGAYRIASGIIALTCLLLVEKSRLHALVGRIDDVGLRAGVRFGVMALVILPLLPTGPFGPFGGIRPRELWALVLFFSGLSFLGYVARRALGSRQGLLVAGLLGGLVSSTNVTFTFARMSRVDPGAARALAFGALAANAILYPRVLVAIAVLNIALLPAAARYLALPALIAAGAVIVGAWRARAENAPPATVVNPLQLVAALQMAAVFQAMLMLVDVAGRVWGAAGVYGSAALLGLTDVDALTVSMSRGAAYAVSLEAAAVAIGIGVLSNTVLKLGLAAVLGSGRFRAITAGVLAMMAITAATVLIMW
jgi:uncharacterized membrane protein (DUF4010 family)